MYGVKVYQGLLVLVCLLIQLTLESPTTSTLDSSQRISSENGKGSNVPNSEISYTWQSDNSKIFVLPTTMTNNFEPSSGQRVFIIHRMRGDGNGGDDEIERLESSHTNIISNHGFNRAQTQNPIRKSAKEESNNVFVFCLMFIFGLIICGLIWCLCTVSRNHVDDNGETISTFTSRRLQRNRRRADIEVILPNSSDLPPNYDDIVGDFEKLGSQCILPSYRDIMTQKPSNEHCHILSSSPPPMYSISTSTHNAHSTTGSTSNI